MKSFDATNKVSGIELFLFPFEDCSAASLEAVGREVILPNAPKRAGKSESRIRSYWAGRAAVRVAFKRLGIQGFIHPEPNYGYLQVVNSELQVISDLFVNISHTDSIVALALSPFPVGVDIELATRDASRVMSRVATDLERSLASRGVFATNGRPLDPNIALWSAKEAAAKAVGLGMKFGLSCFEIHFAKDDIYRVKSDRVGPLNLKSPTLIIESFDPYIISVCSELEVIPSGRIGRSLVSSFDLN